MGRKTERIELYIRYTVLFAVCSVLVFMWYFLTGRTFVWHVDGYGQYLTALKFYGQTLRQTFRAVAGGEAVPMWSFAIGEGADILNVMHYYAIGDPINLLSVFFPEDKTYILFDLIVYIRLYLAGISFIYMCRTFSVKNERAIEAGALMYVFSYWAVYNAARHIPFLVPMIIFPLMISGAHRILKGEKPYVFTAAVFMGAICNIYFFYMMVILTVIFCVVHAVFLFGKSAKKYPVAIRNVLVPAVIGTLMGGVIFVPVAYSFMGDDRMGGLGSSIKIFFPLEYYRDYPAMLIGPTNEFWLCLGFGAPVIVSVILLILSKGRKEVKIFTALSAAASMFAVVGRFFNGMSYVSNRYSFIFPLVFSYVMVVMWDDLCDRFTKKNMIITVAVYAVIAVWIFMVPDMQNDKTKISLIVSFVLALLICFTRTSPNEKYMSIVTMSAIVSIATLGFTLNSAGGDNYAAESMRVSEMEQKEQESEPELILDNLTGDEGFFRYAGVDGVRNAGTTRGLSTIMYDWSLSNPYVTRFISDIGNREYILYVFDSYDDRTIETSMSSVLYDVVPEGYESIPYGFEYLDSNSGRDVYINRFPIGLTYGTDDYLTETVWESEDPVRRGSSLIQGVVIDDREEELLEGFNEITQIQNTIDLDMRIIEQKSADADLDNGTLDVSEAGSYIRLGFDGRANSETYVVFENLRFDNGEEPALLIKSGDVLKLLDLGEDGYEYFNGRRDFAVNLGYREEAIDNVLIASVYPGRFTFDSIRIISRSYEGYEDRIEQFAENALDDITISTNKVEGTIANDEDEILVFTIPYSEGWTATVDGKPAKLLHANIKYMALNLPAGEHTVVLTYRTPLLTAGIAATVIGIAALCALVIIDRKNNMYSPIDIIGK